MIQDSRFKNRKKSDGEGLPGSEFWHRNSLEANCWQSQMPKFTTGFTLIEMIVSVAIFSMVVVVSTGAVFTIIRANQKVQTIKSAMGNLSFALESMSRVIKFSTVYHCGTTGTLSVAQNCAYPNGDTFLAFKDYRDGTTKRFRLNSTSIESGDGSGVYSSVTGTDVTITRLSFYVENAGSTTLQPRIKIIVQGYAGPKPDTRTTFNIQTMISQREILLD